MSFNYRELVESLDAIMQENEENGDINTGSEQECIELFKEITSSLISIVEKIQEEGVDYAEIQEKLQKACDILADAGYNDTVDAHTDVPDESDEGKEPVEESGDYGTEGMGPKVDSEGHRSYKQKGAPSYAARQGFTGL